ncbi:hypothetical protein BGX23_003643 [Mortierella sp. AD031]|nr:hypothetical protein BGX23_003643 [Mortierella sp. AD031]
MYEAVLEELQRPGPVVSKKDVHVSKQIKMASLIARLDNDSNTYMSVKSLLSDLLQSIHPQIDFDRHCPPEFGQLKKHVWTMLCDTPEKTAAYTTLQIMNQIILWIERGMLVSPTSEQVYVTAWSLIFNILLFDTNIRAIPGELISKSSTHARQRTEDAFGSTTSTSCGRKVDLSIRIKVENQWKTEIAIFEFKSSTATQEICKKQ